MNRCIYCNANSDQLSDEHIVPEGIGGNRIIKLASCNRCRDFTSKVELRVLRQSYGFWRMRAAYAIGRRRKQDKPTTMNLSITSGESNFHHELPIDRSPVHMALPLLAVPSQITNGPRPAGVRVRGAHLYLRSTRKGPDNTILETGTIHIKERTYDHDFAKMLAKIAWAAWVYAYPDTISEAWLPDVVTGKEMAAGRFVGNADYAVPGQPAASCLHSIHLGYTLGLDGVRIALARIHLFLQLHPSPTYLAAIGVIRRDEVAGIADAKWHLPFFGEVGIPMKTPLPKWLGTKIYSGGRPMAESEIYKELKVRGFAT